MYSKKYILFWSIIVSRFSLSMAINVSVQHNGVFLPGIILTVDPMPLPSGNPFKCHKEVLYLQPMIPPKRFDILPLTGECSD